VLAHELGHTLGLADLDPATHAHNIMAATLAPGVRKEIQIATPNSFRSATTSDRSTLSSLGGGAAADTHAWYKALSVFDTGRTSTFDPRRQFRNAREHASDAAFAGLEDRPAVSLREIGDAETPDDARTSADTEDGLDFWTLF
jgi:hypothetical protein